MTRALKIQLLIWGTVFIFMVGMMLHIQQLMLISMILALIGPTSYLLSYHRLRGLRVRRTLPARMTAGEASEVTLTLSNPGARTRPVFWVEDQLPPGLSSESDGSLLVLDLAPREEREVSYQLQARRRGFFRLGPVRLWASDTLALHDFEETLPVTDDLLVYPRAIPLISLWPRSPADRASPRRSRRRPGGIDPRGTREYVPGDDLRHIHWKLSARRNRLMLVEREQAEGLRATLLLDLSPGVHVGQGSESTLEYGVTLAASLLVQALEEGGSAALVAHGDRDYSVASESTPRHRWKLLEALARVQDGDPVPLAERAVALVRRLPRGSAVTVVTPQIGPGMIALANLLSSHSLRVVWFLLVAPTFEAGRPAPLSEERYRQQAGDLARRGQTAYLIAAGTNVEASLGRWMREAG
jgi:uncharacterized protein (DUF58 family)